MVVQKYLPSPYLIKGCKFDLRVYVVITSIDPLRIYIYDEGLVRFCVKEYSMDPETIGDSQIHVCNYAVNKDSDKFTDNEDPLQPQGHKWTLSGLWTYFSQESARPGCLTPSQMWTRVEDMVIKSVLCGLSSLRKQAEKERRKRVEVKSSYNTYKIFGYDILLDSNRVPHLIEINSRPCALSDKLDAWVNRPMVSELFKLVGYHIPPGSLATMDKKITACTKLNIPYDFSQIGYNPTLYWNMLDSQGATKQKKIQGDRQRLLYRRDS